MRNLNVSLIAMVAVVIVGNVACAAIPDSQLTYLSFPGWDSNQVLTPAGQTFTDVFEDIDVNVHQTASTGFPSVATGRGISTGQLAQGSHSFVFTFSDSLPLVVENQTTDREERFEVFSAGSESYMQLLGNPAIVMSSGSGISITGTGFGTNTGAAKGQVVISPVSKVTVTHASLTGNPKYERFRIAAIPEPGSFGLAAFGLVGLLLRQRKRNR